MWSGLDLTLVIVMGLVMAGGGLIWLWREQSHPSLLDRQEGTLIRQHDRMDRMQHEIDELRRIIDDNHESYEEELAELRAVLDEWWHGMRLVFEQMTAAQLTPVWQPKPIPARRRKVERPSSALAEKIAQQFNIDEMNSMAFDIGILPEEFVGATRDARARELVELCHRRGITAALEARRKELRDK